MKLIIAGTRTVYLGVAALHELIQEAGFVPTEIVSGCGDGMDTAGESYAIHMNLPIKRFPPNWAAYGRAAGPTRNHQMAQYGDALLAVWDGKSPGTKNMVANVRDLKKPTFVKVIRA